MYRGASKSTARRVCGRRWDTQQRSKLHLHHYQALDLLKEVKVPEHEAAAVQWHSLRNRSGLEQECQTLEEALELASILTNDHASTPSIPSRATAGATIHRSLPSRYLQMRITASRAEHRPVLQIKTSDHPETTKLLLDVKSQTIDTDELLKAARNLGAREVSFQILRGLANSLWKTWLDLDALAISADVDPSSGAVLNAHIYVDPFALGRQKELAGLSDPSQVDELEQQASQGKLFYVKHRDGNIACYGYGAGLAMSTQDALAHFGGKPANFLDGGGGATAENVQAALGVVSSDPDAKAIFINSFGGLTKMDLIAQGLVDFISAKEKDGETLPPIVARLRGTGEEEAAEILNAPNAPKTVQAVKDLEAAAKAVIATANASEQVSHPEIAATADKTFEQASVLPVLKPSRLVHPRRDQYESTIGHLSVPDNAPVLVFGTGKASQFHNKVAQSYGTNIIAAVAPGKSGEFLGKQVFGSCKEALRHEKPYCASLFVPPQAAASAIIECIEAEIPLIVSIAEGIPTHDQLRVQAALRSQSKSRVVGANCPGMIVPSKKFKIGIQPLAVHRPGTVGLASRSGTISYELASAVSEAGYGQSVVFGLGGDPFPCTRTWEALEFMLYDDSTEVICIVGEIGGQMEEEAAAIYLEYQKNLQSGQRRKPVVGFVAGQQAMRGREYGHSGAIWWDENEQAGSKIALWRESGITVAEHIGQVGGLIQREMEALRHLRQ